MIPVLALAVLFQVTPTQQARVGWVPNPRIANSWVSDPAHHLQPATIVEVNAIIGALEHETSAEIGVAVVDSTSGLEPQEFATTLHRVWGVGKAGKDNGVLFLWDPVHRKVFISVGYGLEGAIPDRKAGRIRDDSILPAFRASHFDAGVLAGVRALAAAARTETDQRVGLTPTMQGAAPRRGPINPVPIAFGIFIALLAIPFTIWYRRSHRVQRCPKGHGAMRLLSDEEGASKLDDGAKVEQRLKSVDWRVWVCPTCGETTLVPHRHMFTQYEDCPDCKRRTVGKKERELNAASVGFPGSKEVTRTCENCGWKSITEERIPPISAGSGLSGGGSSGGSSGGGGGSSGGSFGGGSAGGAGAGGSY